MKPKKKMRTIPPGFAVRRKVGRDEEKGVVRIELEFTLEEWDEIELKALGKGKWARQWIIDLVRKKIGSSSG